MHSQMLCLWWYSLPSCAGVHIWGNNKKQLYNYSMNNEHFLPELVDNISQIPESKEATKHLCTFSSKKDWGLETQLVILHYSIFCEAFYKLCPVFACEIWTDLVRKNCEKMLVLKVLSNCSGVNSSIFSTVCCSAALLTRMSIRPYFPTTASITWAATKQKRC